MRVRCRFVSAYDIEKGSQFRAQFYNICPNFIHHFSDLTAPLTGILRKSQPQKVTLTFACLEAFETLKLRLISELCLILPEVISDAMFTVATYA
jgi:hypothetical protein